MCGEESVLVSETFASNWIAPVGPQVEMFEKEVAAKVGSKYSTAVSSGTAALHLALRWAGVGPEDRVICPSFTFCASTNPIVYEGGQPVFVDSDRTSWNMDPNLLGEALKEHADRGRRPKAVIVVHLYGQCADIDAISNLCDSYGIPLIEDAAEALGAVYYSKKEQVPRLGLADIGARAGEDITPGASERERAFPISPGTRGLCGVYSFNGNKIITTSGGGMLVSQNQALIEKATFWSTQARDPLPYYQHSELGYNYRLSNVLAAIGRAQLRVLEQRVNARRRNYDYYYRNLNDLPGLGFMPEASFGRCTRWLTCITVDPDDAELNRDTLRLALAEQNIEARPTWKPMHLQPLYRNAPCYGGTVSAELFETGLCLPSGSAMSTDDLDRVISTIRDAYLKR